MHRTLLVICTLAIAACTAGDNASANASAAGDTASGATAAAAAPTGFAYAGITVPDTFATIVARYPLSKPRAPIDYMRLLPSEAHDGITAIGFVKGEAGARVSISFEKDPGIVTAEPPSKRNPKCEAIQDKLIPAYGQPDSLRQFANDTQTRSDRYWSRGNEVMVLICFRNGDTLYADALALERHKSR